MKEDLRRKEYPLQRVIHETWTHDHYLVSTLECGHRILAPRDRSGAQPAKRRRCYECYYEQKNKHGV